MVVPCNSRAARGLPISTVFLEEFGQFIGEDIRLVKVNVKSISAVSDTLEFYMGKNTPDRRDYIVKNLI